MQGSQRGQYAVQTSAFARLAVDVAAGEDASRVLRRCRFPEVVLRGRGRTWAKDWWQIYEGKRGCSPAGWAEIYDRNDYATERAAALTQWANYLDGLKAGGAKVIPIKAKRA